MARCDESAASCNCVVHAGRGMEERGSATPSDPLYLDVVFQDYTSYLDTATIDFTVGGSGVEEDPRVIQADLAARLSDLTDVTTNVPTTGQVLGFNGVEWTPQASATAAPGAILSSGGVTVGDGSAGSPMRTAFNTRDFLAGASGLELQAALLARITTLETTLASLQATRPVFLLGGPTGGVPVGAQPIFQMNTALATVGGTPSGTLPGSFSFPLPSTFPNGLAQVVMSSGDANADVHLSQDLVAQAANKDRIYGTAKIAVSSAPFVPVSSGVTVRVSWVALGW